MLSKRYGTLLFAILIIQSQTSLMAKAFMNVLPLMQRHHGYSQRINIKRNQDSKTTILQAINLDELDNKAQAASEAWDMYVTPFMSPKEVSDVENRLGNRADVACFRIGALATSTSKVPTSSSTRSCFLFTNPDLGMDYVTANNEYCVTLCVEGIADVDNLDPWPNILTNIGVDLNKVGDIFTTTSTNTAYLVVDPEIVKV